MISQKHRKLFGKKLSNEIPVYYRFLRKTSKAETDKIELGDATTSVSDLHRSSTYLIYETFKPHSKFDIAKKMIK